MARRPRGSLRHRLPRRTSGDSFDALVDRALARIPAPYNRALREVAIVVEDEPTRAQLFENGLSRYDSLYGLYEGVPRTEWGADLAMIPNKITLFRVPLEEDFADPAELEHEVWVTVIHELAHHLGIDDDRLHELGAD